ncbi:MAG: DUF4837 family protein [Paludibacteraceae bacterium]|nr:DUF4837 family protein [Paludibacteraceae bacterium]
MKTFQYFSIVAICAILISCDNSNTRTLTAATGSIYECLVVMDNHPLTQDQLNAVAAKSLVNQASAYSQPIATDYDMVKAVMEADMPCMPQMEPYFKLTQVNVAHFDDMFKPTRNILIIDINPQRYTQLKVKVSTNYWSKPQAVCRIQTPSQEEFVAYWLENGEGIREWFINQELQRQVGFYQAGSNKDARAILERQGYDMLIPSDYIIVKDTLLVDEITTQPGTEVQVLWCCNNKGPMRRDILVYNYPYTDTNAFTLETLNAKRDAVLSQLVSGSVEGSYMGTEYKIMPPQLRVINVQDSAQAYEVKGLWKLIDGEAMGGPYISHTRLDYVNGRVVTSETFLYAAGQKKRTAIRQAEAILYTLTLPEDTIK